MSKYSSAGERTDQQVPSRPSRPSGASEQTHHLARARSGQRIRTSSLQSWNDEGSERPVHSTVNLNPSSPCSVQLSKSTLTEDLPRAESSVLESRGEEKVPALRSSQSRGQTDR